MLKVASDLVDNYLWKTCGEYEFSNRDNLGRGYGRLKRMGIPESEHYNISFYKNPEKRKNRQCITLTFNSERVYTGIRCEISKSAFKRNELLTIEAEAIAELIKNGMIEKLEECEA